MMKLILPFFLFFVSIAACGQWKMDPDENFKGNVKTVIESEYKNIKGDELVDGSTDGKTTITHYDQNGEFISSESFDKIDDLHYKTIAVRNSNNKMIGSDFYENDFLSEKIRYKSESETQIVLEYFNSDDERRYTITIKRTFKNGRIMKDNLLFEPDARYGDRDQWYKGYDTYYKYDADGNMIHMEIANLPGEESVTTYTYEEFDEKGNWIKRISNYVDNYGESSSVNIRKFEYYD